MDKDKFSFHEKDKQAKIQRQFDKSAMIELSCKHKGMEKKAAEEKKKIDDFMAVKSDKALVSVTDTTPVACQNKKANIQ